MRAAVLATGADLLTFLGLLAVAGPAAEANPLVAAALAGGAAGLVAVLVAKLAILVVLVAWRAAVGRHQGLVWAAGAVIGAAGALSNAWAVLA